MVYNGSLIFVGEGFDKKFLLQQLISALVKVRQLQTNNVHRTSELLRGFHITAKEEWICKIRVILLLKQICELGFGFWT